MIEKLKFLFGTIRKFVLYFVRPELSIKQKLVNIVMALSVVIMVPSSIVSIAVGNTIWGLLSMLAMAIVLITVLVWANKNPSSQIPSVVLVIMANLVIFPVMYFGAGGRHTGMIPWMIMGAIITWIITDGPLCYIIFAITMVVDVALFLTEMNHPEMVHFLDAKDEFVDLAVAYFVVSIIFGVLFKYQTNVYEKQKEKLLDKEKDLREANADLERASKAKSDFLASMSHEIRTPINAVLGMDEMILRESSDNQIRSYAEDIEAAGNQLLALINDILDLSKIESGKLELHPAEYELFSILNDSYNMINLRAKKKNLTFLVENEPDIPAFLYGDEIRVRQIIVNLLTNAVKYTKEGSIKLSLSHRKLSDEMIILHIEVKDTGMGIREENLEHLFESFTRLDETINKSIEGTGLGLSITRQFVEMMNGKIWAESVYGEGSTFFVEIEQKVADENVMGDFAAKLCKKSAPAASEKSDAIFTAPDARVLVVDDVKMNLNVVRLLLKRTQVQIDLAISGKEALSYCKLKHYDMILLDHMMPEMDGIETLHEMEKMEDSLNKGTPIVALTANAIVGVEQMYLSEGFTAYLSKPVKSEALEKLMLKLLPPAKIITGDNSNEG